MIRILAIASIALAAASPASAQSLFDKLKKKARETVEETIEDTIGEATKEGDEGKPHGEGEDGLAAGAGIQEKAAASGAPAPAGRWQGQVGPGGKKSVMGYGGVDILLSDDANTLRYAAAASRCLAELSGGEGKYEARFITGQSICGTRAAMMLDADGALTLEWTDAPNTPADEKVYVGSLRRTLNPWPMSWSAAADERAAFDAVGFRLGMSYEKALAHLESAHPDLDHEWRLIVDEGSTTIVEQAAEKGAKKVGFDALGEKLSLLFEAQTPEEMEVEQDPQVLARRAEIDRMQEERAEKLVEMRRERSERLRTSRREIARAGVARSEPRPEDALPPIPDKPSLRPGGADAELLVIGRSVVFPPNARPHEANVMQALEEKYGSPSVRLDQGTRRLVLWAFDASGTRLANAKDGACDHISKAPGRLEGTVTYYGTKGIELSIPPTVSPDCGLTAKAELRYDDRDRGVRQLSVLIYDQQRLLGDEWYKFAQFSKAYLAKEKAKEEQTKKVAAPDL